MYVTNWGPTSEVGPDVHLYAQYLSDMRDGRVPYRDFLFEYPPGALAPILAAGLFGGGGTAFQTGFELLMLSTLLVVQWQAARLAGDGGRAVAWSIAALPLVAGAVLAGRFDLLAVAFVVGGLAVLAVGDGEPSPARAGWALALLAAGTLVKLFPIVVAAVALAWLWGRGLKRAAGTGAAVFAAVVLVVSAPFVALSPSGFAEQFTFQTERPVQIESTPASVIRLLGGAVVTGTDERPNAFRSQALEEGPAAAVAAVSGALQLALILLVVLWTTRAARAMPRVAGLVVPAAAAVLAFVALGKVLSPQYMIWLAPLAPLLWIARERAAALLVLAAVLLTQLEYPHRYTPVVEGETGAQLLLGARNAALLAALALLLVRLAREAGREVDSLQAWIGSRQWPPPTRARSSDNAGSASRRSGWRSSVRSPTRRT